MAKYTEWLEPEKLTLITGWARDGLTDEEIAHNMGINRTTLYRWRAKSNDICNALKVGKEVADYIVENALFRSACGYDVVEAEDKIDMKGNVVPTTKTRHVNASVTAQIFWLKNRRKDKWRDSPETAKDTSMLERAAELLGAVDSSGIS